MLGQLGIGSGVLEDSETDQRGREERHGDVRYPLRAVLVDRPAGPRRERCRDHQRDRVSEGQARPCLPNAGDELVEKDVDPGGVSGRGAEIETHRAEQDGPLRPPTPPGKVQAHRCAGLCGCGAMGNGSTMAVTCWREEPPRNLNLGMHMRGAEVRTLCGAETVRGVARAPGRLGGTVSGTVGGTVPGYSS